MRTPQMQKALEEFTEMVFGRKPLDGECVICGKQLNLETEFRDELSAKEYGISHMCQTCQDDVFAVESEEVEI